MKRFKRIVSLALALTLMVAVSLTTTISAEAKSSKTTAAASTGVVIGGVLIQGADVVIATSGAVASEDGVYHLIASDANQVAPAGTEVAQAVAASGATFTVPLSKGTANSMLYKKFTVCVLKGGALTAASNSMYITNP